MNTTLGFQMRAVMPAVLEGATPRTSPMKAAGSFGARSAGGRTEAPRGRGTGCWPADTMGFESVLPKLERGEVDSPVTGFFWRVEKVKPQRKWLLIYFSGGRIPTTC